LFSCGVLLNTADVRTQQTCTNFSQIARSCAQWQRRRRRLHLRPFVGRHLGVQHHRRQHGGDVEDAFRREWVQRNQWTIGGATPHGHVGQWQLRFGQRHAAPLQ
jgi:hypothetical protein